MSRFFSHTRAARFAGVAAVAIASLGLTGCFGDDDDDDDQDVIVAPTPTPTPTPTPAPSSSSLDVGQCLNQEVAPGTTVADLVIPDVLRIDPNGAAGFPNGRLPADPVVDVTLAVLLLDLSDPNQNALTFANLPLNPDQNDIGPPPMTFPYLLPPQGNPPIASSAGSGFNFRGDAASAYVRVDRMGMPAVATALIPSDLKIAYNDANPADDAAGTFVDPIVTRLTAITDGIDDDLLGLGLNICAD